MADLKAIYAAVDEPAALDALDAFSERWDKKYPKISQSWRDNWANLSTYFKYPQEVRRLVPLPLTCIPLPAYTVDKGGRIIRPP